MMIVCFSFRNKIHFRPYISKAVMMSRAQKKTASCVTKRHPPPSIKCTSPPSTISWTAKFHSSVSQDITSKAHRIQRIQVWECVKYDSENVRKWERTGHMKSLHLFHRIWRAGWSYVDPFSTVKRHMKPIRARKRGGGGRGGRFTISIQMLTMLLEIMMIKTCSHIHTHTHLNHGRRSGQHTGVMATLAPDCRLLSLPRDSVLDLPDRGSRLKCLS